MQVLERPLVGRLRNPERRGADGRARDLEGRQRTRGARALAGPSALELALQLLLAAEQVVARNAAVLEHDLGGLRRADAELGLLVTELQPGVVAGDDERCLPAVAERGVDGGDDHGHVGDAAVGDEGLGPVQDPVVAVALRGRAQRLDVGAGRRLGDGVGADLGVVLVADHLRDPAADLLGRAGRRDAGRAQRGGGDRERDAGAAPVELLGVDDALEALRVGLQRLDPVEAGELPLIGLAASPRRERSRRGRAVEPRAAPPRARTCGSTAATRGSRR